jgi:hypothetical protein
MSRICKELKNLNSQVRDMAQVVECLPSDYEALDSIPSTEKKINQISIRYLLE